MFGLAATTSHIACGFGITAAAGHPPNAFFEIQKHPPIMQSNISGTTGAAAAVQQQRTSHRPIYTGGTPVVCVLCYPFSTCDTPRISSQPHPERESCMIYCMTPTFSLQLRALPSIIQQQYTPGTRYNRGSGEYNRPLNAI